MELTTPGSSRMEAVPNCAEARRSHSWARATGELWNRLGVSWRVAMALAGRKRKALCVRETAALGDRRFVSVIQFEGQRFLIGSSAAAITLLARLPDAVNGAAAMKQE